MKNTILSVIALLAVFVISKGDYWTQKSSCPVMRKTSFNFSIGTKGYTGSGRDSLGQLTKSFWEYNSATNAWTQKADVSGYPREGAIGFAIGSKGYAGLGCNIDHSGNLQDFYEYDTATNAWTPKAFYQGMGSAYAVSFVVGNYGYVCTGTNGMADYQELWQYDPAADCWNQKTGISGVARQQATAFAIGTKGYIIGGYTLTDSTLLNDFWEYNTLSEGWQQLANAPGHARCDAAAFSLLGKGYFGIGDTAGGSLKDFWEYEPTNNHWTERVNFPGTARDETSYFTIADKGYIGLGGDGGIYYDFWEYTPDAAASIPENSEAINVSVFPNPFKEKTTLTITGNSSNSSLIIYNIYGAQVLNIVLGDKKEVVFGREKLTAGIYFYELVQAHKSIPAKGRIVIE